MSLRPGERALERAWTSDSCTAPSQAYTSNAVHCGSSGFSRAHCSSKSSVTPSRTPSASRTSFSALSHDRAWSWVNWMRPPTSGSVSSISWAAACLALRSAGSV